MTNLPTKKELQQLRSDVPITRGNSKLPASTAILSITPASLCVAKLMGFCQVRDGQCYAKRSEVRFAKNLIPLLMSQMAYWDMKTAFQIAKDILDYNATKRSKLKALRIGVAGDLRHQPDLEKSDLLAYHLKPHGITTYIYTAMRSLDFSEVRNLVVNTSGWTIPGANRFQAIYDQDPENPLRCKDKDGNPIELDALCPGDCRICSRCLVQTGKVTGVKIH